MARTMKKTSNPKSKQTFTLTAPEAGRVQLTGEFTRWEQHPISLTREAGGVWRAAVALPRGTHRYRFRVDGEWRDDPDCPVRVANPFGSQDMVRQVD